MFKADQHLRTVSLDGYKLTLWDTYRTDRLGKSVLGYQLQDPDNKVLFEGEDFSCSPLHAVDSDETLRSLLGYLTMRPGDTDPEYFEDYTEEQLAFAHSEAESLAMYAIEGLGIDFEFYDVD